MKTTYECEKKKIENMMKHKERKRVKAISKLFKIPLDHILTNIKYNIEMGLTVNESIVILERILKVR